MVARFLTVIEYLPVEVFLKATVAAYLVATPLGVVVVSVIAAAMSLAAVLVSLTTAVGM